MLKLLHFLESKLQFLGVQAALRKWVVPSRQPSPWAGTVSDTSTGAATQGVSIEKCRKCQTETAHILELGEMTGGSSGLVERLVLQQYRGFIL